MLGSLGLALVDRLVRRRQVSGVVRRDGSGDDLDDDAKEALAPLQQAPPLENFHLFAIVVRVR